MLTLVCDCGNPNCHGECGAGTPNPRVSFRKQIGCLCAGEGCEQCNGSSNLVLAQRFEMEPGRIFLRTSDGGSFTTDLPDPQAAVVTERITTLQIVRVVSVPRGECECGEGDCHVCGN